MKQTYNMLKSSLYSNKKLILFLLLFTLLGIISGTIFVLILNDSDKSIIINYIGDFIKNIKDDKINITSNFMNLYIPNLLSSLLIWILGISIIGIPVILFIYFSKMFVLGFTVATFILKYKFTGVIYSFLYLFPSSLIEIIMYLILINYSFTLSYSLFKSFFKRGNIDFKPIMKRYVVILLITIIILLFGSLYEVFISSNILRFIIK